MNIDVTVDDGKYRFTQDNAGQVVIYRHGEEWMAGSFRGINMMIAMACEIEEAREKLRTLEPKVEGLESLRPVWAQGWTSDSQAAQASAAALAQVWGMLQVDNQTAAVAELQKLIESSPQ